MIGNENIIYIYALKTYNSLVNYNLRARAFTNIIIIIIFEKY